METRRGEQRQSSNISPLRGLAVALPMTHGSRRGLPYAAPPRLNAVWCLSFRPAFGSVQGIIQRLMNGRVELLDALVLPRLI